MRSFAIVSEVTRPVRRRTGVSVTWAMVAALTLAVLLASHRYRLVLVVGNSMVPTFRTGMVLVVDLRAYAGCEPARGDLVVAQRRDEYLVKRVVGLPGEKVELRDGRLYVNDVRLTEDYSITAGPLAVRKGLLGPGRFALLGDNRNPGPGQVAHAVVPREAFLGRVTGIVLRL